MASNETVADIVREMVEFGNHCAAFGGAYSPERWDNLCKRLNAAHKRALAAKDDARLTIVANYETVIAAKDREIAELRECLKEAISASRIDCGICNRDCEMKMLFTDRTIHNCERIIQWRKALEGVKDEGK